MYRLVILLVITHIGDHHGDMPTIHIDQITDTIHTDLTTDMDTILTDHLITEVMDMVVDTDTVVEVHMVMEPLDVLQVYITDSQTS